MRDTSLTRITQIRFVRFLMVGGINTAFSYCCYALGLMIGMQYAFANLVALLLGILFSFKTQGNYVFYNTDNRLLGRFVFAWALIYIFNISVIRELVVGGLSAYAAGAIALPIVVVFSYLTQKYVVFRQSSQNVR